MRALSSSFSFWEDERKGKERNYAWSGEEMGGGREGSGEERERDGGREEEGLSEKAVRRMKERDKRNERHMGD